MNCELTKQEQIAAWITGKVASGELGDGEMIPPEVALAKEFQVNRGTVSRALDSLKQAGLLLRRPGKGSFVAAGARDKLAASTEPERRRPPNVSMLGVIQDADPRLSERETWRVQRAFERRMAELAPGAAVTFHKLPPEAGKLDARQLLERLARTSVQGICVIEDAIAPADMPVLMTALKFAKLPFVLAATDSRRPWVNRVSCSHHEIGLAAARHLHALGHRSFAFAVPDFAFPWIGERFAGFQEYLAANGVGMADILQLEAPCGPWPEAARRCGLAWGRKELPRRRFTAVFAGNDSIAAGIMDAAAELGLRIPDDFSLVGVDNATALGLNITSIPLPVEEIAEVAAALLLKKIGTPESRKYVEQIFVLPEVVGRLTTAAPKNTATGDRQ